jgi:hypothetical protein
MTRTDEAMARMAQLEQEDVTTLERLIEDRSVDWVLDRLEEYCRVKAEEAQKMRPKSTSRVCHRIWMDRAEGIKAIF